MADFGIGESAAAAAAAAGTGTAAAAVPAATTLGLTAAQWATLGTIASLASTTAGLGMSVYDRANQPGVPGIPKPPPFSTTSPVSPGGTPLPPGVKNNYVPPPVGPQQFMSSLSTEPSDPGLDVLRQLRSDMTG